MDEGIIDIDPQEELKQNNAKLLEEQAKALNESRTENATLRQLLGGCTGEFKEALKALLEMDAEMRQGKYYDVGARMQTAIIRLEGIVKQLGAISGEKKND